eukprot:COSAG01_NODE_417_length_17291_cov_610.598825_9_plen_171_part_00
MEHQNHPESTELLTLLNSAKLEKKRDNYAFVGAIVIAPSSIGATPYYVGAATITLDSIGATTTALDYSRFYRVRGLITPTLVGAALDTPTYMSGRSNFTTRFYRVVHYHYHFCRGILCRTSSSIGAEIYSQFCRGRICMYQYVCVSLDQCVIVWGASSGVIMVCVYSSNT